MSGSAQQTFGHLCPARSTLGYATVSVCVCVRACVRACMHACVRVHDRLQPVMLKTHELDHE